jgi:predicted Zn finger-like uncharacterized protein
MIAACPHCKARYRIERERLPAQGARLRCARCRAVFRVSPPASEAAAQRGEAERRARPRELAAPGREGAAAPPAAVPGEAAAPRRLVLIADPDVEAGKALVGALAAQGLESLLVHDGVEAILAIQRALPSLVVLEASLPKMFGFQVCELVKRNEQLRSIPVVLVGTIHHRDRYRRQAAETYGADHYLERPQLPEALLAILRERGIVRRRTEPSPPPPAPARPAAPPARPAPAEPEQAAEIARAERLARIIVSDIVLYNPERFEAAIRSGDVVAAMAAELEEGRAHFRERIPERIRERKDFLGEELVRVARQRGAR